MELSPRGSAGVASEGWVVKQSRTLKRWRRRWLVLTTLTACTYKQQSTSKNPTERLPISDFRAITSVEDDPAHPYLFRLDTTHRSFLFSVDSKENQNAWIQAIGRAITTPAALRQSGELAVLNIHE